MSNIIFEWAATGALLKLKLILLRTAKGMNTFKHLAWLVLTLLASIWGIGCASFAHYLLPETGQLRPPSDQSQTVKASYQFTSWLDSSEVLRDRYTNERKQLEQEFVSQLRESGYFSSLQNGVGEQLHIEADIANNGVGAIAICGSITQFTFLVIPCWETVTYRLKARIVPAGGKPAEYVFDDAVTEVLWLPMIIAAPFANPDKIIPNTRNNMYRNLVLKMQEDGLLLPRKSLTK